MLNQRDEQTYSIIGAAISGINKALLLNFGMGNLQHKRLVFNLRESAQSADSHE